jgi:branched-subunit amino acid aminotransferase/4-amino-4-deoxychorismate lyase
MADKPYDRLDGVIWYDGKLVPWGEATLHVLSHGLHYGSSVFEGERAYGGEIFKCTEHSQRLKRSAELLDFDIPYSVAEIDAAKRLVLEQNGQTDAYVRPVAWRGSEMMGVSAQTNKIHLAIATWQWPSYFRSGAAIEGHPPRPRRLSAAGPGDRAGARQGRGPLHDLHHLQAQGRAQRLCRRPDAGLAGPHRRMHRRQHLLHQ